MAVHKYLANNDGGYFYRFQPILSTPIPRYPDDYVPTLFGPIEYPVSREVRALTGFFIAKFNDKAGLIIRLMQKGILSLQDHVTNAEETRELSSIFEIVVPGNIYNYPFVEENPYMITTQNVYPL